MGRYKWTKIDPDYLPEDGRALLAAQEAAREALKQCEAEMREGGLNIEKKIGIDKNDGKAPCSNCLESTSHKILHTEERNFDEAFQLIECAGCGRVSMAHTYDVSTMEGYWIDHYPSPISRAKPWWIDSIRLTGPRVDMDYRVRNLFHEIYEALAGGQHRLTALGIRALLEQVMVTKVGDHGSFGENLNAFREKGLISLLQRDALSAVLDLGHAAMHRMYEPTESDLNTALDITEGILAAICVHGSAATELSDRVPARRRTGKVIPWKEHLRREGTPQDEAGESQ